MVIHYMDNRGNSRANTCAQTRLRGRVVFIRYRTNPGSAWYCGDSYKPNESHGFAGDESFKFLTYQLPTVGYWPTVAMTGNGELGFDSGEGA